ncbi:hypothetical protein R83H12_00970 [Fibrobacteria bacterium R8-3-H12]
MNNIKYALAFILFCSLAVAAQGVPFKLAVYVLGTTDANLNKALSNKLLAAMVQGGSYVEIANAESFQTGLASSKSVSVVQISQAAKQRGADVVCVVNLMGNSGVYTISANLIKTSNAQVVKTSSINRTIKSMDDLTMVSNELAKQFLPPAAPQKQCAKTYSINEIVSGLEDSFPSQLKDCSSKAKEAAASKRKDKKDPKVVMKLCATDAVKKDLPEDFPGTDKVVGLVENFVQNNAADGTNIDSFLSDVKKTLGPSECVVEPKPVEAPPPPKPAPVAPPADIAPPPPPKEETASSGGGYLGIRIGINSSHLSATSKTDSSGAKKNVSGTYNGVLGFQAGVVIDMAPTSLLHIQPGFMYTQKGTENNGVSATAHYIEVPLLLSLNVSVFRLNVGPYLGMYIGSGKDRVFSEDFGLNFGLGIDIGMFHIGGIYDYGLANMSYDDNFKFYNRTLGLNLGVNL